jgi:HemY protein
MDRREGAYLLLADIEEAETGDEGKVRQLLARAVRAPRDPAWVADGVVSERWQPLSPVTGRLDAFEWRAPVERIGQVIENAGDGKDVAQPVLPPPDAKNEEADAAKAVPADPVAPPAPAPETPAPASVTDTLPPDVVPAESESEEPIRLPDDPGVGPEEDEPEKASRRFRLF